MLIDMEKTLSRSQAARALGVSGERISQIIRTGQLGAVKSPLGKLIPADEVERLKLERANRTSRMETAIASR